MFICLSYAVAVVIPLVEAALAVVVHVAIQSQIISNQVQVVFSFREAGGHKGNTHRTKRYKGMQRGTRVHRHTGHTRGHRGTPVPLSIY